MEEPVPTSTTGDDDDTKYMSPLVWQTALGSGLHKREEAAPPGPRPVWAATILWSASPTVNCWAGIPRRCGGGVH